MPADFLTTGQLCEELEIPEHIVTAMIRSRHIAPPEPVAGRRLWARRYVAEIRNIMNARGGRRGPGRPPRRALAGGLDVRA
jgi:hypothetical protein